MNYTKKLILHLAILGSLKCSNFPESKQSSKIQCLWGLLNILTPVTPRVVDI
jgi:hypothetical protein